MSCPKQITSYELLKSSLPELFSYAAGDIGRALGEGGDISKELQNLRRQIEDIPTKPQSFDAGFYLAIDSILSGYLAAVRHCGHLKNQTLEYEENLSKLRPAFEAAKLLLLSYDQKKAIEEAALELEEDLQVASDAVDVCLAKIRSILDTPKEEVGTKLEEAPPDGFSKEPDLSFLEIPESSNPLNLDVEAIIAYLDKLEAEGQKTKKQLQKIYPRLNRHK